MKRTSPSYIDSQSFKKMSSDHIDLLLKSLRYMWIDDITITSLDFNYVKPCLDLVQLYLQLLTL